MTRIVERFARAVVFARWWFLVLAVSLALPAYFASQQLNYDRSIENMLSPSDPVLKNFRQFERVFGKDQIVLLVYEDEELFSASGSGLRRSRDVTNRLKDVDGVADVLSIAVLDRMLSGLGTSLLERDPLASQFRQLFSGYTHSADDRVAAAVCLLGRDVSSAPKKLQAAINNMRAIASDLPNGLADGVLVGEPVMINDGFRYVEQDGKQLWRLSTILLGITMLLCLRSLRWVLIALAVVTWSTIITKAMLVWGGWQLSMVSSMLSANLTVVGVASVMHLALGWRDDVNRGLDPKTALEHTFALLLAPVTWAALTDAVGFMALLAARAGPIRDYGFMMTLGSVVVLVAVVLIVPATALAGLRERREVRARDEQRLERTLMGMMQLVERYPLQTAVALIVAFVVGSSGMLLMKVETDFTRNFRTSSPIAASYGFVEERLGGAGVWDVMVPAPPKLTEEYLLRVEQFEDALRKLRSPGGGLALTKVLSLADVLRAAERRTLLAQIPLEMRSASMQTLLPDFVSTLRAQDSVSKQWYLCIMLRAHDRRDAAGKQWLIAEVNRLAQAHFKSNDSAQPVVTGSFVLLTNLVAGVLRDQWICFAVALAGVGLAVSIALYSVRMAVLVLIVNTLPVCVLLGIAGWMGVRMNMGVAMIGAVSMGLSVDSALHYLYVYQRGLSHGKSFELALHEAHQTAGRALVYSTIALAIGFASMCASQFLPTVSFGALSALALIGSVLCNLTALPLLLRLWHGPNARATVRARKE